MVSKQTNTFSITEKNSPRVDSPISFLSVEQPYNTKAHSSTKEFCTIPSQNWNHGVQFSSKVNSAFFSNFQKHTKKNSSTGRNENNYQNDFLEKIRNSSSENWEKFPKFVSKKRFLKKKYAESLTNSLGKKKFRPLKSLAIQSLEPLIPSVSCTSKKFDPVRRPESLNLKNILSFPSQAITKNKTELKLKKNTLEFRNSLQENKACIAQKFLKGNVSIKNLQTGVDSSTKSLKKPKNPLMIKSLSRNNIY